MSGELIIGLVLLVVVALAVGGAIAQKRRMEADRAGFGSHLDQANLDLASAHAEDKGWDPETLEAAALAALDARHPGAKVSALTLAQVVDRPGMEDDEARYRARVDGHGELLVTMLRRDGGWVAQRFEG